MAAIGDLALRALTLAIVLALVGGCACAGPDTAAVCTPDPFASGPKFSDYRTTPVAISRPANPDVYADAQSKVFRTHLREGAAKGPNFAGHYTIVSFGCGAGCQSFAIVDAQSGRVFWPRRIKTLEVDLADPCLSNPDLEILRYRPDSNLIIAAGLINEDEKRLGISYFVWDQERLKLAKFVPLPGK